MYGMLYSAEVRMRNLFSLARGILLKLYLLSHGCKAGKKLKCKKWPVFRLPPDANIFLGDYVNVGYRITFDVKSNARLEIGNHVDLTQNIIISASEGIRIGDFTLVAEDVSIRDADHGKSRDILVYKQPLETAEIIIGKDVWISSGCRILKGCIIPDGIIIGANSVVNSSLELKPYGIYVGSPARFIRERITENKL